MAKPPSSPRTPSRGGAAAGRTKTNNSKTAGRAKAGGSKTKSGHPKAGSGASKASAARKRLSWPKRILLGVFFTGFAVVVVGLVALIVAYSRISLPDPNAEFLTETTQVYYNDAAPDAAGRVAGTPLGDFADQNRTVVDFDEMPQSIKDAVLAAENRSFWTDPGISFTGIVRSVKNIILGEPLQSGSTITQQYIKTLYLTSDQTATRKVKEILLSIKMGRGGEMTKRDVLAGYLNTIYFGRGAYGVQAAAQTFFGVDAKDMTVPQSAALAALLNAPADLDPALSEDNVQPFVERYRYVLEGMLELGQRARAEAPQPYVGLTAQEYAAAVANPPDLGQAEIKDRYGGPQGFLLSMVENELVDSGVFTPQQVQGGGLKIVTTFDYAAQQAAITAVQQWTESISANAYTPQDPTQLHGGLTSVAVGTGEVMALYGGPDYVASQWNWATTPRQAGSTFKPYALIAALKAGLPLSTTLKGSTYTPAGDPGPVSNDSGAQYGTVTLANATTNSVNTAYVDLVTKLPGGPQDVIQAAQDLGLTRDDESWDPNDGRIALGKAEVSTLEAANAFATLANDGLYLTPHVVREVWDHGQLVCLRGQPVDGHCSSGETRQALDPNIAATATSVLRTVMTSGTGRRQAGDFAWPVAGKTGTAGATDGSIQAAWFIGYTKQISTAVMFVAGDSGAADLRAWNSPDGEFYGGVYPGRVWRQYMDAVMVGRPAVDFTGATALPQTTVPEPSHSQPAPASTSAPAPTAEPVETSAPPVETTTTAPEPEPPPATSAAPEPSQPAPTAPASQAPG
ncbi:MAG: transglycosylase domain-containing protein [Propionibacteriaceae bacterium]|jgi:membrane peptidoglycan carboxypeptidase|nr:transglycosylase domain-containing protein [Propionibacteriaceae bacterium]